MTNPQDSFALPSFQPENSVDPNAQVANNKKNTLALVSLILGIVSLVLLVTLIGSLVGWLTALIGVILAFVALAKLKNYIPANQRKAMSFVALLLNIIALGLNGLLAIGMLMMLPILKPMINECGNLPQDQVQQCMNDYINTHFAQ